MAAMGTKPDAGLAASQNGAGQGTQGEILRQVPPKISPGAQKTIRGKIKIRVRVHVNTSGDVTRADLVTAGPSRYFARVVGDAAKQWKFAPSSSAERRWMLQFDLTRGGTVVHPQKVS
jgi:TonB family protein